MDVKNLKNLNKFSNDPVSINVLDKVRKVVRTLIVNDRIRFPDFEVATGITRDYLRRIMVEEKVTKYDAMSVIEFFDRGKYKEIYDKECLKYHSDMRRCYSYLNSGTYENKDLFGEFESDEVVYDDPGVLDVIPIIGYFGKFMFKQEEIGKYDFTMLQKIVICQVLSANAAELKKMDLYDVEIAKLREKFTMYIPALFIRHCPLHLPVMVLPEVFDRILKVEEEEAEEKRLLEIKIKKEEDERIAFLDLNSKFDEMEVADDNVVESDVMNGQIFVEEKETVIFFQAGRVAVKCKDTIFPYEYDGCSKISFDAFEKAFMSLDIKSRIVLSVVCKNWYNYVKKMKNIRFDNENTLPSSVREEWMDRFFMILENNGCLVKSHIFLYYMLSCVKFETKDISDYLDHFVTYAEKFISAGTFLLLTIFYLRSRNLASKLVKELENIYNKLSRRAKSNIRNGIKKGEVKCTGYNFRVNRGLCYFDKIRYWSDRKNTVWNGYEALPVSSDRRDRDKFQYELRKLIQFEF